MSSINPLFSLVEAAQLVGSHQQKAPFTASVREGQQVASSTTHEVSDDDQTIASRMIALRENHLMALRAAATNAGLTSAVPSQTAPRRSPFVPATYPRANYAPGGRLDPGLRSTRGRTRRAKLRRPK